jgi:hypothetical protein
MDPNETQDKAPEPNEAASAPEPAGDGERAKDAARDTDNSPQDDEPVDLERRILCPDGACIGVIGPDGTCKECGTPMDPADGPALAGARPRIREARSPRPPRRRWRRWGHRPSRTERTMGWTSRDGGSARTGRASG